MTRQLKTPALLAALVASGLVLAGCQTTGTAPPSSTASHGPADLHHALWDVAASAQASHDYAGAARHYAALLEAEPTSEAAILGRARNLRYSGHPRDAVVLLEDKMHLVGNRPALLLELAKAQLADDQAADALPIAEALVRTRTQDWEVQSVHALALDRMGRTEEALAAHRRAYDLAPNSPQAVNNLALAQAAAGDLDGAIGLLGPVTRRSDAPVNALQNMALFHALRGDIARAEPLVRRALPPEMAERSLETLRRIALRAQAAEAPIAGGIGGTAQR